MSFRQSRKHTLSQGGGVAAWEVGLLLLWWMLLRKHPPHLVFSLPQCSDVGLFSDNIASQRNFCYTRVSMSPEKPGLDLAAIEAVHKGREAPPNKHADGQERRFILGEDNAAVAVDVYPTHPALVRILTRTGEEALILGRVRSIAPDENGGIRIKNTTTECLVGKDGRVSITRTPPEIEFIPFQESAIGRRKGKYTQAMLEAGATKEGDRVERSGTLEAAPKPVNKGRNSPLQFVLVVDDPDREGGKDRLEVHATKQAKEQLQRRKLVRDDRIEAVLYRHTWTAPTIGGDEIAHERYHLATILAIERKDERPDAKRTTRMHPTKQE